MLLSSSSSVIKNRGYIAVTRKYNIQCDLSKMTDDGGGSSVIWMEGEWERLTGLGIRECHERRQETRDRCWAHDPSVAPERVDTEGSFAHMNETLSDPDHEQTIRFLVIITSELSEHLRQPSVVRPCANEAHSQNRVERYR